MEERTAVKDKEVSKLMTEECWIRGDVECKSQVHDSSAANKNHILRESEVITIETKDMADEKLDDIIALDESLDTEKDEEPNDKPTGEPGLEKVDVNRTEAEQDLTQDQAKPTRVLPKFDEWETNDPASSADGFTVIFNKVRDEKSGALNDEFDKVQTFDFQGRKGSAKGIFSWSSRRGEALIDKFHKVKTFDLRGIKSDGKGIK